jgi:hypothetical protein
VLSSSSNFEISKKDFKNQITMIAANPDDATRLLQEFENAIQNLPQSDLRIYLPVILHSMSQIQGNDEFTPFVLKNAHINWTISMLDLGLYATGFSFPGSDETADPQKPDSQSHSTGNAVDLTLLPWYLKTGIALKSHYPHILHPDFNPFQPGNGTAMFAAIAAETSVTWNIATGKYYGNSIWKGEPYVKVTGHTTSSTPESVEASRNLLTEVITRSGLQDVITVDDLFTGDQTWYHIGVEDSTVAVLEPVSYAIPAGAPLPPKELTNIQPPELPTP